MGKTESAPLEIDEQTEVVLPMKVSIRPDGTIHLFKNSENNGSCSTAPPRWSGIFSIKPPCPEIISSMPPLPAGIHIEPEQTTMPVLQAEKTEREHELTKTKKRSAQMEKLNLILGGGIHNIRGKLTSVIGNADYLLECLEDIPGISDDVREAALEILKAAHQASQELSRSLTISKRMTNEKLILNPHWTDSDTFSKKVLKSIHGIPHLSWRWENIFTELYIDSEAIASALLPLIENASKYSQKGKVEVHVTPTEDALTIEVIDEGPGISEKLGDSIFETHGPSSSKNHGYGIGLAYSKMIAEAHGGTLTYCNNPNGRGATFRMKISMKEQI